MVDLIHFQLLKKVCWIFKVFAESESEFHTHAGDLRVDKTGALLVASWQTLTSITSMMKVKMFQLPHVSP